MQDTDQAVAVLNAQARSVVVLVCEHASRFIPDRFHGLGLPDDQLESHVVWDPGALDVALRMSRQLGARLVAGGVSRLVYDCNRPPDAPDAIPARSEVVDVPGNAGLDAAARSDRIATVYEPFRSALSDAIAATTAPVIVTIHSFTPVYNGQHRAVEIGILHDTDTRLADHMLEIAPQHTQMRTERNQPYGPDDGVTHTLREHAIPAGHLNVMIEIRNDLIATPDQQDRVAATLVHWLVAALENLGITEDVECSQ